MGFLVKLRRELWLLRRLIVQFVASTRIVLRLSYPISRKIFGYALNAGMNMDRQIGTLQRLMNFAMLCLYDSRPLLVAGDYTSPIFFFTGVIFMIIDEEDYLMHYGILGMHWGERRFQNKDGTLTEEGYRRYAKKNLKKARASNLDKWGTSKDSNVLYVIGASGSGKSTTALGLAGKNDSVIHLDSITQDSKDVSMNKDFKKFCESKGVKIDDISNENLPINKRIKELDKVSNLVEPYGQKCYAENRKVIVEGVQMIDETMFPDKQYFKDKPVITIKTGKYKSSARAALRDGNGIKDTIAKFIDKERYDWYDYLNNGIDNINSVMEHSELIDLTKDDCLVHYGVLGMHWGIRKYQESDGTWTPEGLERRRKGSGHVKRLLNYDGPAYFISETKLEDTSLIPRIPKNFFTENGYEEAETPRVCFAPSVDECLAALSKNIEGKTFYIYSPVDISKCEISKPDNIAVPDSDITNELWCTNAVDVQQVGKIKVTGNRGEEGMKFKYGDNEAVLYNDWEYEFK